MLRRRPAGGGFAGAVCSGRPEVNEPFAVDNMLPGNRRDRISALHTSHDTDLHLIFQPEITNKRPKAWPMCCTSRIPVKCCAMADFRWRISRSLSLCCRATVRERVRSTIVLTFCRHIDWKRIPIGVADSGLSLVCERRRSGGADAQDRRYCHAGNYVDSAVPVGISAGRTASDPPKGGEGL